MAFDIFICPVCNAATKRSPIVLEHMTIIVCPFCNSEIIMGLFTIKQWHEITSKSSGRDNTLQYLEIELNFDEY